VRFAPHPDPAHCATPAACDANNDQSTIRDSSFEWVKVAAISIEHSQSHQHRLQNVNAGSYPEAPASAFVSCGRGSFSSIGGFQGDFTDANFVLGALYGPVTILDSNSEGSRRFIRADDWNLSSHPVRVIGARFAVQNVPRDADAYTGSTEFGHVVRYTRRGPLVIEGLYLEAKPTSGAKPVIYFDPPVTDDLKDGPMMTVTGCIFGTPGSDTWDPIRMGAHGRLVAYANSCAQTRPCIGLGAGVYSTSKVDLAQLGTDGQRLQAGHWTWCSDCKSGTSPCAGGGAGAVALRTDGTWDCGNVAAARGGGLLVFTTGKPLAVTSFSGPNTGRNGETDGAVAVPLGGFRARTLRCRASAAPGGPGRSWSMRIPGSEPGAGCTGIHPGLCCVIAGSDRSCSASGDYLLPPEAALSLKIDATTGAQAPAPAVIDCSLEGTP
jgi:hypothetical protein